MDKKKKAATTAPAEQKSKATPRNPEEKSSKIRTVEIALESPKQSVILPENVSEIRDFSPVEVMKFDIEEVEGDEGADKEEKKEVLEEVVIPNSTLRSDRQQPLHDEPTNSVSDLVNFESFDEKSTLRFLKPKEEDEESNQDYLQKPPLTEEQRVEVVNEEPESNKDEDKHPQEVRASQAEESTVRQKSIEVTQQQQTQEKGPPLSASESEENDDYIAADAKEIADVNPGIKQQPLKVSEKKLLPPVYDTYEEFVASINMEEPEFKPVVVTAPVVAQTIQEKAKESFKDKAAALEKARFEAKEKQKKQELDELKRKAKEKELQLKRKIAALRIQNAYHRFVLVKKLHRIHESAVQEKRMKETAGLKIVYEMLKWNKRKKKEDLLKRYMNHCAALIQDRYKKHLAALRLRAQKKRKAEQNRINHLQSPTFGTKAELITGRRLDFEEEPATNNDMEEKVEPMIAAESEEVRPKVKAEVRQAPRAKPPAAVRENEETPKADDDEDFDDMDERPAMAKVAPSVPKNEVPERFIKKSAGRLSDEKPIKPSTTSYPDERPIKSSAELSDERPIKASTGLPDERPIKTSGKKSYDLESALAKETNPPPPEAKPNPEEPKVPKKKQFLKRKDIYDPRKAIEAAKKSTAAPQKKEPPIKDLIQKGRAAATPNQDASKSKDSDTPRKSAVEPKSNHSANKEETKTIANKKEEDTTGPAPAKKSKKDDNTKEDKKKKDEKKEEVRKNPELQKTPLRSRESEKDQHNEIETPPKRDLSEDSKPDDIENRESPEMKDEDNQVIDENGNLKQRKDFLKRKSKKIESKKLSWQKVPRKIDCWNPKQKDQQPKSSEKTSARKKDAVMPAHRKKHAQMQRAKTGYLKKKELLEDRKEGKEESTGEKKKMMPIKGIRQPPQQQQPLHKFENRVESDESANRLSVEELHAIYMQYHGDDQSTTPFKHKLHQ